MQKRLATGGVVTLGVAAAIVFGTAASASSSSEPAAELGAV